MIKTFKCRKTEKIFRREHSQRFRQIETVALRKLLLLESAGQIDDLRIPPGNRLEKLGGDRKGQYIVVLKIYERLARVNFREHYTSP